ncbi:MAG: hypothetical protein QMD85_00500, partial [Candidatus Aenigmarchaeota archaeon]|nr:hypothetical protein [Candidatus Aenigmarchaeota archaeon]MDI6721999.1 hypothetical protein [Candidatus Aenigmarchaeota archaeon]
MHTFLVGREDLNDSLRLLTEIYSYSWKGTSDYIDKRFEETALGINSSVKLYGGRCEHLGMIDFDCEKFEEELEEVRETLKELEMGKGFIMDSGNSYHFIG